MSWSDIAIPFIQGFESCRLIPYQDQGGVWTCGWGSTGADVIAGQAWSQEYADSRFETILLNTGTSVDHMTAVPLTDNQKAALVSLAYNIGQTALADSTLIRLLNQGNYDAASQQFLVWNHVNHVVEPGLTRRREAEQALFNTPT